jgi:RNA polymerase sigma factor (sigma-70 family)
VRHRQDNAHLEALRQIYCEHHALVRAVVVGRGVPEAAVDDVVHDAFLAIHRRLDDRPDSVSVRQWVVAMTRNVAFSHRRGAARRQRRLTELPAPGPSLPLSVEMLDARRAWGVVSAFLEEIPPAQREVFMLCQLQGLSLTEVAQVLGCSPNTVGSRLRLARTKFARHFPEAAGIGDHAALLRTAARGAAPTPSERRSALAVLMAQVTTARTAAVTLSIPSAVWHVLGGMLAAGAVLGAVFLFVQRKPAAGSDRPSIAIPSASPRADAAPPAVPVAAGTSAQRETGAPPSPRESRPTVTVGAAATVAAAAPARAPTRSAPAGLPGAHASATPDDRSATRDDRSAGRSSETPAEHASDDLAEQTRLLQRARRSLDGGDPARAAELLRQHAHAFAASPLAPERTRLEIAVQCALGHRQAAIALARRLVGIQPPNPVCPE